MNLLQVFKSLFRLPVTLLVFALSGIKYVKGQSCLNLYTGADTTVACNITCFDLRRRIPDIRSSETYQVISIPYQSFAYTTPWGQDLGYLYQDDKYSDTLDFSFPFCFYGQVYSRSVVGSNGLITFDVPTNALKSNSWRLRTNGVPVPIPYAGGLPNSANSVYYPRAAIMAPYQDPNPAISPPNRKIEARTEGSYPCRKFIVSFYNMAHFGNPAAINTYQIVMHEGTGVFDIFIAAKPDPGATGTNAGVSILGIQNWERNAQVSVPGRNCTNWSAVNEGWRFVPNGNSSLLSRVELHKNGSLVATGAVTVLGNGELDVIFPNICQLENAASYTVRAFYKRCDDPGIEIEASDTVMVFRNAPLATALVSPPSCSYGNGTITITAPVGPSIKYSIDGGLNWQISNLFSVPTGSYTILARDTVAGCTGSGQWQITGIQPITLSIDITNLRCFEDRSGALVIHPAGVNGPWQYSIDGGSNFQQSPAFTGLTAGAYAVRVRDPAGCAKDTIVTVTEPPKLSGVVAATAASCKSNDGTIQLTASGGTPLYSYSIDNGLNFQPGGSFTVGPGSYNTLIVKDSLHCIFQTSVVVPLDDNMFLYAGNDTTICEGEGFVLMPQTNPETAVFHWSPALGLTNPDIKSPRARPGDTITYILSASYGLCHRTDSILINVLPRPLAFAGRDTAVMLGIPYTLSGSGGVQYSWQPVTPLNNPFIADPVAVMYNDTRFALTVTGANGCKDQAYVIIKVYKGPAYYIPTAFTPNGDGLNDYLRPIAVGIQHTAYFRIYNRYGQIVFSSNDTRSGWDGKFQGVDQASGTYVWMIKGVDIKGNTIQLKGQVTLIR